MNVTLEKQRPRLSAETRQRQIVETLLDLVAERGADAVSVQAIADRIGLTQPAVFRHFPNKETLWASVMEWLEERLTEIHRSAQIESTKSALSILRRIFLDHVRMVERHPALAKIVFSDHLRLQFPSLQAKFAEITDAYQSRVVALLRRAKAQHLARASLRPEEAATLFFCMVQGLGFQFAIARRPMRLQREAEQVFALYLRAVSV